MAESQPLFPREDAVAGRLRALRGRLAASRAAEDLQRGAAVGALAALLLGGLRLFDLAPVTAGQAAGAGVIVALLLPAWGMAFRRTSPHRVALLVDERLGLAERVATALALEERRAPPTPLAGLVATDALARLRQAPAASLRRVFRPRLLPRSVGVAAAALLLSVAGFRMEPLRASEGAKPKDLAAAYREEQEKKDAQKAARRVKEAAREMEEAAKPKEEALRAVAAELRRQAEEMLRRPPAKAEAMAAFRKMGELVAQRQELLAGMDLEKMAELRDAGKLAEMDPELGRLLDRLLQAGLPELHGDLESLEASLQGLDGAREWDADSLQALQSSLDELADLLEKNAAALEGREGLKQGLGVLGNPELLREISRRIARLMQTLKDQGWEACKGDPGALSEGLDDFDPGEPLTLTDEQLQAILDRLEELQKMAELGMLAQCQNCGLSGGT